MIVLSANEQGMRQMTGHDVVAEARRWLGTPWRHQARLRAVGVDCGGLVVCVAQALELPVQDHPPGYARLPDGVSLRACVERQCMRIAASEPGAVLLMRWAAQPQHLAIVSTLPEGFGMIHAWAGIRRVVEHGLTAEWRDRIVQDNTGPLIYRLPGLAA
jgi:NlpC/P60 family putative phage cell wall peptidase